MKKFFTFLFAAVLIGISSISVLAAKIDFDGSLQKFNKSQFQVTERTAQDKLDYGLEHIRDVAISQTDGQRGGKGEFDPQVLNVLTVPSRKDVRVVNWTYSTTAGWNKATVTQMAEDFERKNPGWIVLAGVNGDFFDINGHANMPFQTSGVVVTNGDVVRPCSSGSSIGYTNNGTEHSMIGGQKLEFSELYKLAIYDANGEIIKTFDVSRFNEAPQANEISVYYTYPDSKDTTYDAVLPGTDSYLVEDVFRCYGMGNGNFFGKGTITDTNKEQKLVLGTFGIVTNNPEVTKYLAKNVKIRVQRDVEGAYAECDNITGGGATLMKDGEITPFDLDDRHPRTVLGAKADGSLVFMVVDGRQQESGMTGMTQEELGLAMKYYGCEQAYNVDGGGSTTMIIRNETGGFDVKNTPSDGDERRDANAILVVVPKLNASIEEVSDTSAKICYDDHAEGVKFSNIRATVTDGNTTETRAVTSDEFLWEGLKKETEYEVVLEYDMTYEGKTSHSINKPISFTTGKEKPRVIDPTYQLVGDQYILRFKIEDPSKVISIASIKNGRYFKSVNPTMTVVYVPADKVQSTDFVITLDYNLAATPNSNGKLQVKFVEYVEPQPEPQPEPAPEKKGCSCKKSSYAFVTLAAASLFVFIKKKH